MSFVAIDMGASSTRYASTEKFAYLPNNAVYIEKMDPASGMKVMDPIPVEIDASGNDFNDKLEVIITKEGESSYFPVHALLGSLAASKSANNVTPTMMNFKSSQRINYISCITAVAASKLHYNLDDDICIWLALPPNECRVHKETMKENLVGKYEVNFVKVGTSVRFTITDVKCHEESALAMFSYFFDVNGKPREESKNRMSDNILSIDIGASTTDLAVIKKGVYQDKSGQTYKYGGNTVKANVSTGIQKKFGFEIPDEDLNLVMAEGCVHIGKEIHVITEIMDDAKKAVADSIVSKMVNYFSSVDISLQSISTIVVSGGGSMASKYLNENGEEVQTSAPMSKYITDALMEYCSTIDVVNHPENPRQANIRGLFTRAYAYYLNKSKV